MEEKVGVPVKVFVIVVSLLAFAAITLGILAVIDGNDDGGDGKAESPSQQTQGPVKEDGESNASSSAGTRPQEGSQEEKPSAAGNPNLVPAQIPASSVDEALLRQAAQDFLKKNFGDPQAFMIMQVKISSLNPDWGKVTFYRQDQDLTMETLFYRQGGIWAPAQAGQGATSVPSDI